MSVCVIYRQKGVALIVVMWVVAALALLVGGMLAVSRAEVHRAQIHQTVGHTTALGDAAIQLAALEWKVSPPLPPRRLEMHYQLEGVPVTVRITPVNGYISLNGASEALLHDLFHFAGGVDEARATELAQRVIDWRDPDEMPLPQGAEISEYVSENVPWRPRNGRFLVIEDLMQVLGMDFEVFDRIRSLVTVWSSASGVDPRSASEGVLAILAAGDRNQALQIMRALDAGDQTVNTTGLNQAHLTSSSGGSILHMEAIMPADEQRMAIRGRWISLMPDHEGAPWRTLAVEPVYFIRGGME